MGDVFRKLVLVSGTRDEAFARSIEKRIETDLTLMGEGFDTELTVIEGGAKGVDHVAGKWARRRRAHGVANVQFKADWKAHGNAAGPIRNQEMLDWLLAAEAEQKIVLAYPGPESVGTWDMVDRARRAGVAVVVCGDGEGRVTDTPPDRTEVRVAEQSETPVVLGEMVGTVQFSRKVNLEARGGNKYENAEASVFIQFSVDPENPEGTLDNARAAFLQGKSLVFSELGLDNEVLEGVLVEKIVASTGATKTRAPQRSSSRPSGPAPAPTQHGDLTVKYEWDGAPVPEWLFEAAAEKGVTEVYDNRGKLKVNGGTWSDRSPHFKSTGSDETPFWPPKD